MAVDAPAGDNNTGSMRERELEVEIARLNAEIAVLQGGAEPAEAAARLLTMAASTVDAAMADARKEADELAVEVSAAAEARRDEATRVAQEVEAHTESLRVEAQSQEQVAEAARHEARTQQEAADAARHEAQRVTNAATQHINKERARVAEEVERLADVRSALESERSALETYHEELKRRVQELAESMVAFMTTEPPLAAVTAIDDLANPAIAPVAAAVEAAYAAEPVTDEVADTDVVTSVPEPEPEPAAEFAEPEPAAEFAEPEPEPDPMPAFVPPEVETAPADVAPEMVDEPEMVEQPESDVPAPVAEETVVEQAVVEETVVEQAVVDEVATPSEGTLPSDLDPAVAAIFEAPEPAAVASDANEALFGRAAPTSGAEQAAAPYEPGTFSRMPAAGSPPSSTPSFTDMMSGGAEEPSGSEFGGVPVTEASADGLRGRRMGGLFSRNRGAAAEESIEPVLPEAPSIEEGGLFGSQASRLIEQTSPDQLASALADEGEEDERFRSFLDGDGDNDPSRDWLLRPDQDD